ncbi:transmembrane protein 45A-like [Carassius auratus]|uniref:Transmembrane protein 45A-like n=1 Tax=Carassius auratus TaxID=7957 RepID=A0A6P6KE28_CARAU|nr:transmembrane protein 45A-like [Carassius auratus]
MTSGLFMTNRFMEWGVPVRRRSGKHKPSNLVVKQLEKPVVGSKTKQTFLYTTRRNKSAGVGRLASRAIQCRIEERAVILAFSLIGFLFLDHLHGRDMLDVHVHTLLLYAIFGQAFICLLEVFHRGNILLELLRATLTVLQGSWFWQIGFVLYPPSQVKWDQTTWLDQIDHDNAIFVTLRYCWHLAFALLTVAVVYLSVLCAVRSRLRRMPPLEMGLLKPREKEVESEDEIL